MRRDGDDAFDAWIDKHDEAQDGDEAELNVVSAGHVVFQGIQPGDNRDTKSALLPYEQWVGKPLALRGAGNPQAVLQGIAQRLPWLAPAVEKLMRSLRLSAHTQTEGFTLSRPLLMVGPPGIGKSWLSQQLAKHLELPTLTISAAGKADNVALRGVARGWNTQRPSEIVSFMLQHECANPLVLIDEIDKISSESRNGNMHETLLQMFEPLNAATWRDDFLLGTVDLSRISWVCTANDVRRIPEPLLNRMDVLHLNAPQSKDERRLMLHSMTWEIADAYGMRTVHTKSDPYILPMAWPNFMDDEGLIEQIMRSADFRSMRKLLLAAMDGWIQHQQRM